MTQMTVHLVRIQFHFQLTDNLYCPAHLSSQKSVHKVIPAAHADLVRHTDVWDLSQIKYLCLSMFPILL